VQHIEHVHLGRHAGLQGQLDSSQHRLFVVVQHQSQHFDHLAVATGLLEQSRLQLPEGRWQFDEGRAVAQRTWLALQHRKVMAPVVDGVAYAVVAAVDDASVFAEQLALGGHHNPLGIDAQAHRSVGKRGRHAVANALEGHQARGRDALGVLHETIEGARRWH